MFTVWFAPQVTMTGVFTGTLAIVLGLLAGAAVALFSSALPYTFEMFAMRSIPKRTFGVLLSVEPAIGAMAGMVLLHEQLSPLQWLAIGCIVAASIGAVLTAPRGQTQPLTEPGAPA